MKYDFEGYATKNNIRCSDGVTIRENAFKHCDGKIVPIVWNHSHDNPDNVLGHGLLEARKDGIYVYGSFNNTERATNVKEQLMHGDYNALSIYANKLTKNGSDVVHGDIKEVSIVLAGANPGATIERVSIAHGDGSFTDSEDSFVMHMDADECNMAHYWYDDEEDITHADDEELSTEDMANIYENMSEEQQMVVQIMVGEALTQSSQNDNNIEHNDDEGDEMRNNLFEQNVDYQIVRPNEDLVHSETVEKFAATVWNDVRSKKMTFRESFIAHAQEDVQLQQFLKHDGYDYGISNIEILFPEAQTTGNIPEYLKRDTGWVSTFMNATKKRPFTRLKSRYADLTEDEARAKGYITGNRKVEEVFGILQRTTDATTIYKKQKLDRDNILDASDFDLVAWLWGEMRIMLNEEIAVACLLSDGRPTMVNGQVNPDKIDETKIRPIWKEDELFAHKVVLSVDPIKGTNGAAKFVDEIIRTRKFYKGTGNPVMYTTSDLMSELLLMKDNQGHYIYDTMDKIKTKLRVSEIHEVEQMEGVHEIVQDEDGNDVTNMLAAILVNPNDYEIGTNKGGQITSFNQFDIDYNQEKMLLETRLSGSLTKVKSALIYTFEPDSNVADYKNNYFSGKQNLDTGKKIGG